ncbi:MAG: hypothetical protein DRG83_01870 [Deltaproteobacteria bacterium]|nr:MAG: hypothetical protein DRG83_01870 [Deltaproteobacteria bacterium]
MNKLKLLFITRHFPPVSYTAGVRAKNVAKYLALRGWDVTVLTVEPDKTYDQFIDSAALLDELSRIGVRIIRAKHKLRFLLRGQSIVAKVLRALSCRLLEIDPFIGWYPYAAKAVKGNRYDLIMATAPPFFSFILAYYLGKRTGIPYVLDYRDPWTLRPHGRNAKPWIRALERKVAARSSLISIVSESWAYILKETLHMDGKIYTISNGYDPEDVEGITPMKFTKPSLVYAGIFYPPKRSITPIFRAMKEASKRLPVEKQPEFHYFGAHEDYVVREAEKVGIKDCVICHGVAPRKTVFQALKGAVLAPVITSVLPEGDLLDKGIVTGKIFEILNLKVPIMLVAPHGSDARNVLIDSNAGEAFVGTDIKGMADYIIRACKGEVRPTFEGREKYSWPRIVEKLDSLLRECLTKSAARYKM